MRERVHLGGLQKITVVPVPVFDSHETKTKHFAGRKCSKPDRIVVGNQHGAIDPAHLHSISIVIRNCTLIYNALPLVFKG